MAKRIMQAVVLICDGCQTEIGASGEAFHSAIEARAGAYVAGWGFPSKITTKGQDAQVSNEVCPECIKTWVPRPTTRPERSGS